MTTIIVTDPEGKQYIVHANDGGSLMQAVSADVPGVPGECGGSLACGTCHIWVDPVWFGVVGDPSDEEAALLDNTFHVRDTSRLSCQIAVQPSLEGLRLAVPHG